LVAVHREKHRAAAGERLGGGSGADRDHAAILAAADPLDADHLGTEIAQQCGAERSRDVAPEIEDANAFEHTSHAFLPLSLGSRRVYRPAGCDACYDCGVVDKLSEED